MATEKLQYAPLTNLGCESEFAKFDNRIKVSGGSTSISTHSMKNIVVTNGLLIDPDFVNKPELERRQRWKWARNSEEAIRAKKLESEFVAHVKYCQDQALKKKELLKKKKIHKTHQQLFQIHGGPITPSTINRLKKLNEKQLLAEIGYLRATVAPDIRQKRRVKLANGRYKFENFSLKELRESIKCVLQPEDNVTSSVELLLKAALRS